MKKNILFIFTLLMVGTIKTEPQKPECGSAKHCYTLLKRIQQFSPEERESFKKEAKEIVLDYAYDALDTLLKTMSDLIEEVKHDKTGISSDLKSKIDALNEHNKDALEKAFHCQNPTQWIEQIKDSKKMEFDVDEFECDQIIEEALKNDNNNIVYRDEVNEWLEHFDPTLPEVNYKKIAGLEALISVLRTHIHKHDKQNKNYKAFCQQLSDKNRIILEQIEDMLDKGIHHPYLSLTKIMTLDTSEEVGSLEILIDRNSKIIAEMQNELKTLPSSPSQQLSIIKHVVLYKLHELRSHLEDINEKLDNLHHILKVHNTVSSLDIF